MNHINEDIVYIILDSYDHFWSRDLARISRVSSAFLRPARKHLYKSPSLFSYRACHLLARSLNHNEDLIPLVHALDLRPTYDDSSLIESREINPHVPGICPGVSQLLSIVHLERLALSGDLAYGAQRFLRAVSNPHLITVLQIGAPQIAGSYSKNNLSQIASIEWDGELANRFHALKSLSFTGPLVLDIDDSHFDYDSEINGSPFHPSVMSGCKLEELRLINIEFSGASGLLSALLCGPASWKYLRTFSFSLDCTDAEKVLDHLTNLLEHSYCSLQELIVSSSHYLSSQGLLDNVLDFVLSKEGPMLSLCTLHASGMPDNIRKLHLAFPNLELLEYTHDGYLNGEDELLQPWLSALSSHYFPFLKALTLRLYTPLRSGIRKTDTEFFVRRGIKLRLT